MSDAEFVCECDEEYKRSACEGLEFYREVEGRKYCVLHCPTQDKEEAFNLVLKHKLNTFDFNFYGVYFPPHISFMGAIFLTDATFQGAVFSGLVSFEGVTFSGTADFMGVVFCGEARFIVSTFKNKAFFSDAKFTDKADFMSAKFYGDADFIRAEFRKEARLDAAFSEAAYFSNATFHGEAKFSCFSGLSFGGKTSFARAKFCQKVSFTGVSFSKDVDISEALFGAEVSFWNVTFGEEAFFNCAIFNGKADFRSSTFSGNAVFLEVTLNGLADFRDATFKGPAIYEWAIFGGVALFVNATFESQLRFTGGEGNPVFAETASLGLQFTKITHPEQITFHSVRLRPHWFMNVDCRKFDFTNVDWVGFDPPKLTWQERAKRKLKRMWTAWPVYIKHGVSSEALHNELQAMSRVENHHRLLSTACRQLATNAEDNNRYGDAARFRYASMDVQRLEYWRGWDIFTLDWWYWLVSGYGERIPRAASCLLILLLSFGYLFTRVGFEMKAAPEAAAVVQEMMPTPPPPKELPLPSFRDGLTYAMSAALFQRPEPKAYTFCAKLCVSLEMIFVPLQAALLALAIRRRFMR